MRRTIHDIGQTLSGTEPQVQRAEDEVRWGYLVSLLALVVPAVLYVLCDYRIIENSFLQSACMVGICAGLGTNLLMPFAREGAVRLGAVDTPGARRIHRGVIPRLGGVAVFGGIVISFMVNSTRMEPMKLIVASSGIVFLISLLDDIRGGTPAWLRLLAQLTAAAILIIGGIRISILPPSLLFDSIEVALTVIWLLGIANAVNFLDGMNGLCSGLVASSSAVFTLLALRMGQHSLAFCSIAMLAAQMSFLGYNIKPARMFLGDSGSVTCGFFLAALAILANYSPGSVWISSVVPFLLLCVPVYDMIFITVSRILTGKVHNVREWLEYVGHDHLHHRLHRLGLSRPQTVIVIWFLNTFVALGGLIIVEGHGNNVVALVVALQAICIFLAFAILEALALLRAGETPLTPTP